MMCIYICLVHSVYVRLKLYICVCDMIYFTGSFIIIKIEVLTHDFLSFLHNKQLVGERRSAPFVRHKLITCNHTLSAPGKIIHNFFFRALCGCMSLFLLSTLLVQSLFFSLFLTDLAIANKYAFMCVFQTVATRFQRLLTECA